jgi:hypothetical protein
MGQREDDVVGAEASHPCTDALPCDSDRPALCIISVFRSMIIHGQQYLQGTITCEVRDRHIGLLWVQGRSFLPGCGCHAPALDSNFRWLS